MKNTSKYNQSILDKAEQLIRYYQVPVSKSKKDVLDAVFQQIEHRNKNFRTLHGVTKKRSIYYSISAAASILGLVLLYLSLATYSVETNAESVTTYRLPDDSRVVVQKNSEIKYKRFLWNGIIKLKGAAYFEVEPGNTFQVKTKLGTVEVLGTRFLVDENTDSLNVQCYEGKVKTLISGNSFLLGPGNRLLRKEEKVQKSDFERNNQFPEFALFSRSYEDESLLKVIHEIENFYNIDIHLNAESERRFRGELNTGDLSATLDIVCTSMQLKYKFLSKTEINIYQ